MRISVSILQYDHGIIRQVLDIVGEVVRTHRAEKHVPELKEALTFLEQFMDRFHHAKEEMFFFPAAKKDCPQVAEEIGKLVKEHAVARDLVRKAIEACEAGDEASVNDFSRRLVDHMTVHITEEENVVFPQVENALQLDTDADIHAQYERFTEKHFGKSYYRVSEEFANDLQVRLVASGHISGIV